MLPHPRHRPHPGRRHPGCFSQRGAAAVEAALTLGLLITLLLGLVDVVRWSLAHAAAWDATRLGAQVAAVCSPGDAVVSSRLLARLQPALGAGAALPTVAVALEPAGCSVANCQRLTVSISGGGLVPIAPFLPSPLPLPAARTTLGREVLSSQLDGRSNPACL